MPFSTRPSYSLRRLTYAVLAALAFAPDAALAQPTPETLRGTVTSEAGAPVSGAAISITRGPDRLVKQSVTDSVGRYAITFDSGTGDYLVSVAAAGFRAARRRVQRQESERTLVADFRLAPDQASLAAVRVVADKPVRATAGVSPYQQETGSNEQWADGVDGQVAPTVSGDINALNATMPNATTGPGGISVLGADPSSNLTTLNGMALGSAQLPRAARTESRFTTATFDPTRGGFSGANTDLRLGPGDRNYQNRTTFITLDAPPLQVTDAVGRALGVRTQNLRASGAIDGEAIRQTLTYNISADYARVASDPATLVERDPLVLRLAGLSGDSVARLQAIAAQRGVPVGASGLPTQRERETFTVLSRVDLTTDSTFSRSLTSYATSVRQGALGFGPTSAPAAGGSNREQTMGALLSLGKQFGEGLSTLNVTRINLNRTRTETTPYLALPGASVLLRAPVTDGDGLVGVTLGGNAALGSTETRWTLEVANETQRNLRGTRHSLKGIVWGRVDGLRQAGGGDPLGTFAFNSLDDFAAGRAASFTRTITLPDRDGQAFNAAAALAHAWRPSRFFSLLYGVRVESNGFLTTPTENPAVVAAVGARPGAVPVRWHASPRVGFTYSFNKSSRNGTSGYFSPTGRTFRYPVGVLRGGVGEFRDLLQPGLIAGAAARTGLPGSALSLACAGTAVPVPAWDRFAADPSAIPLTCADGSGPLGERAPQVSRIDPSFTVPRSWRASLDYNTVVAQLLIRVGGLASVDLNQPSSVDLNFAGTPQITLGDEGGRPVFVPVAGIDAAAGAVSPAASRRSADFGRVLSRVSDLRGRGAQLTLSVQGDPSPRDHYLGPFRRVGVTYTLQQSRREFRGFDGAAAGDPREREWAPSFSDARHVITLQSGVSNDVIGTITLFGRFQSGLPFTPLVQGDVNGDGRGGDRAFVPVARTVTDPTLRTGLEALLATGSPVARRCLEATAGRLAPRNGCRGPWSQTLNIMWTPALPRSVAGRLTAMVYLSNVLGGVDQWLHGAGGLRGWGTQPVVDPVLLVPRGFDAATQRFRYEANPRFADTRPVRVLTREPFRLSVDFSLRLHTNYDLQSLRRAIEPVRVNGRWARRGEDSLMAQYLRETSSIHRAMQAESDSLFLTRDQLARLARADSVFGEEVRAIYRPLARYLAGEGGASPSKEALVMVDSTRKRYWRAFWKQPEIADSIVTPLQRDLMPLLKGMLEVPVKERVDARWMFGNAVPVSPGAAKPRSG